MKHGWCISIVSPCVPVISSCVVLVGGRKLNICFCVTNIHPLGRHLAVKLDGRTKNIHILVMVLMISLSFFWLSVWLIVKRCNDFFAQATSHENMTTSNWKTLRLFYNLSVYSILYSYLFIWWQGHVLSGRTIKKSYRNHTLLLIYFRVTIHFRITQCKLSVLCSPG